MTSEELAVSMHKVTPKGQGSGTDWHVLSHGCCSGRHHFQKGHTVQRFSDGVEGAVIDRDRLHATVKFPEGVVEINQFDPRYVNVPVYRFTASY